jgi:GMP synthase (glutamine-hydrolysing)
MHQAMDVAILKQIPTLAVCFGAQFLAHHLGGQVSKNPRGVEFGPIKIQLTEAGQKHALLQDYQEKFLFATHQDYIEATPPGTTLLAWNDNTPVQAFQFGPVLATQFHVDIPTSRARQLLEGRKQKYLDSGFLKDEQHYLDLLNSLPNAESAYEILHRFIQDPGLAVLKN